MNYADANFLNQIEQQKHKKSERKSCGGLRRMLMANDGKQRQEKEPEELNKDSALIKSNNEELNVNQEVIDLLKEVQSKQSIENMATDEEDNKYFDLVIKEYISIDRDNDIIIAINDNNSKNVMSPPSPSSCSKDVKYLHMKRLEERGYRLTNKKLGEGGYGLVYKVYLRHNHNWQQPHQQLTTSEDTSSANNTLKKPLACKIMLLSRKDKSTALENYSNEIYAMVRSMTHRNIIHIEDNFIYSHASSTDNILLSHSYIIMEYARQGTLWAKLKRNGPFNDETTKRYFQQIANGLLHLHSQGIAHRDLKLGNILLAIDEQDKHQQEIVKLADFGLSRLAHSKEEGLVRFTKPAGTLAYMSPQILSCYINSNRKSEQSHQTNIKPCSSYCPFKGDIWALGVCLYLLTTRLHPFDSPPQNKSERIIFAREMLEKQLRKEWNTPQIITPMPNSWSTIGLLEKLFEPSSSRRITIYDVHKYFVHQHQQ